MRHLAARLAVAVLLAVALALPATAIAQAPPVRLAAPSDCLTNPNCGVGLRSVYGLRVNDAFVKLTVADAGVSALDDGLGEVAVAFTSSPSVSRPDVLSLRDDKGLLKPDHVVPVVRSSTLRAYGRSAARDIRRRLDAASALISTRVLRSLNQMVADGRIPEAVGGEFVDANGLGGDRARRRGPRIVVGFQDFPENETLAYLYAEALRAGGYRVAVRSVGDFRSGAIRALRAGRIAVYPDYARSLLGFLRHRPERATSIAAPLRSALARIGAEPQRFAPGQNRNVFVMKRDVATRLGISKLSDLGRYWPAAGS
jgi:glycine betaine/choline ABC-type transport system substrate-binding protein